jgi:hypothetical protein
LGGIRKTDWSVLLAVEEEASGSFLKKRTKKLLMGCAAWSDPQAWGSHQRIEVFWFFFSKKNRLPCLSAFEVF